MPARIPKACRVRGCGRTTTDPSGFCEAHKGESWNRHTKGRTRQERGYGRSWEKLRVEILKRDRYLCQPCLARDELTPASIVDHIRPKAHGGRDSPDNLQTICETCHAEKTARERQR